MTETEITWTHLGGCTKALKCCRVAAAIVGFISDDYGYGYGSGYGYGYGAESEP